MQKKKRCLVSPRPHGKKQTKKVKKGKTVFFFFENLFSHVAQGSGRIAFFVFLFLPSYSLKNKTRAPLSPPPETTFLLTFRAFSFFLSLLKLFSKENIHALRDGERVVDALGVDLGALEPALVADGNVGDVQVAAGDRGGDEVVAGKCLFFGRKKRK